MSPNQPARAGASAVPAVVLAGVLLVLGAGGFMVRRAAAHVNKIALASSPQRVAVAEAKHATYRASRTYGGTFESWQEAGVGPQFISAYVDTVLVRPGASVKRGDVLATLDCRNASAETRAVGLEARALESKQKALADEAARVESMLDGGFVSPDEAEQELARSKQQDAELAAQRADLARTALTVNDCVLRAPFDGEISSRSFDPGGFVRPGMTIVQVVDRSTVRLVADAPEADFPVLEPGTPVRIRVHATGKWIDAAVSRRSPRTNPDTRTVHFEVDVPDPNGDIPTNTTGEVRIDAGAPVPATEVPLFAASVRGERASLWVVDGGFAHRRTFAVKGELGGSLYLDTALPAGALVVAEGGALLEDGDRVAVGATPPNTNEASR